MARRASNIPEPDYDCLQCGACCYSARENVDEGVAASQWVQIEPKDTILKRRKIADRYIVHDEDGVPHLRTDKDGRCTALRGKLGVNVLCAIYDARPKACMRVVAGDNRCLQYRAERGLKVLKY